MNKRGYSMIALLLLGAGGAFAATNIKISDLPLGAGASTNTNDSFPYVDTAAGITRRLRLSDIVNIPSLSAPLASFIKKDGSIAFTANQSMGGFRLTNLSDPSSAQDASTKAYSDLLTTSRTWKQAVRLAEYENNIPLTGSTPLIIDGITVVTGNRVLLAAQSAPAENGLYDITITGGSYTATRTADGDVTNLVRGTTFISYAGSNAGTVWRLTNAAPITVGVTALTFKKLGESVLDTGGDIVVNGNMFFDAGSIQMNGAYIDMQGGSLLATVIDGTDGTSDLQLYNFSGLDLSAKPIHNVEDPTDPQDAATKNYVDSSLPTPVAPTIQKYTSTGTATGYVFEVSGAPSATVGATYTNNGQTFTVLVSATSATRIFFSATGAPETSGTLTKSGGTGDSTITFTSNVALATYSKPTSPAPIYIRVRMVGGGGGGASCGSSDSALAGGNGGNTYFGSELLVAGGGIGATPGGSSTDGQGGAGGTSSLGSGPVGTALSGGMGATVAVAQGTSGSAISGGSGGNSAFGGGGSGGWYYSGLHEAAATGKDGAANTGGGGGGCGAARNVGATYAGSGGGAGGFVDAIITNPASTYYYAVGAAGAAGAAGSFGILGGAGGSGYIEVTEYYQ